ncbi:MULTISPECIES: alanine racemase [Ruminococcus]|jgi:alanine racemase|uniref:alanine racemase n=1 Tax=Ruminococcus sp. TaxID=41978 RepID=UPI0015A2E47A|nr:MULTISPECIES: alanine racemase [Ruminococcus]
MNMVKRTWAEISLNAIEHNYNVIRNKVADGTKVCCVIKADGYGHGAVELSQIYEKLGADFFAVSNIDEGIEIRKSGSKLPIVILGYTPVSEAINLAAYNISQAVFSLEYAKELSEKCVEKDCICKMHIKVDSGMSRIGFMCQEFPRDEYSIEEICEACCLPNLEVEGLFTHFCVSDEDAEGREFTNKQYENFIHVRDSLKKRGVDISVVHCSNSGAIEDYPETCCDMVRAGIILYGLAPSSKLADRLDLVPAMTLKTVVAFVKEVQKGATISYGRTFTADRKMKIATVPIGYADGFIRQNAKDGYMTVNGKKAKIVGRICMDQTMLDVTDIEDVKTGDEVVVFGTGENGEPTADSLAENTGTINYETVCLVGKRVPRIYIKDGKIENVMYKL